MHTTFPLQLSNQFIRPRYTQVSSIEWIENDHMVQGSCVRKSILECHKGSQATSNSVVLSQASTCEPTVVIQSHKVTLQSRVTAIQSLRNISLKTCPNLIFSALSEFSCQPPRHNPYMLLAYSIF